MAMPAHLSLHFIQYGRGGCELKSFIPVFDGFPVAAIFSKSTTLSLKPRGKKS